MATGVPAASSVTPTHRNLGFMKDYVINYVQGDVSDSELRAVAGRGINTAIDKLNSRAWHWSYKYQDVVMALDTADYTINANFKKPRKLQLLDSSYNPRGFLVWEDPKTHWDLNSYSVNSGTPTRYTIIPYQGGHLMLLNVKAIQEFVTQNPYARLRYMSRVPHLTTDSETLDAPPEVWSYVGWYARWDLATIRGSKNTNDAKAEYREIMHNLKADDNDVDTDFL